MKVEGCFEGCGLRLRVEGLSATRRKNVFCLYFENIRRTSGIAKGLGLVLFLSVLNASTEPGSHRLDPVV